MPTTGVSTPSTKSTEPVQVQAQPAQPQPQGQAAPAECKQQQEIGTTTLAVWVPAHEAADQAQCLAKSALKFYSQLRGLLKAFKEYMALGDHTQARVANPNGVDVVTNLVEATRAFTQVTNDVKNEANSKEDSEERLHHATWTSVVASGLNPCRNHLEDYLDKAKAQTTDFRGCFLLDAEKDLVTVLNKLRLVAGGGGLQGES